MFKKSRFRGPFDKQHGKRAQAPSKSGLHHLYHTHASLRSKLSWKKSLLSTWQILGLLFNTLATDEKYPVLKREYLTIKYKKKISKFFLHF